MYCFPQVSGYVTFFDNGGKYMYFEIENDNILLKCTENAMHEIS